MSIEFKYYCEAQELEGSEFKDAGEQEVTLACHCDTDYADDGSWAEASLTEAIIDGGPRDVADCIPKDLRICIEERALEVAYEEA